MYKEIHEEDSPSISIEELSTYVRVLFEIFEENGAKAILLHEERMNGLHGYNNGHTFLYL